MDITIQEDKKRNEGTTPAPIHWWGWSAVLLVICALLMPQLMSWGMFLDGVNYATVSRNMAINLGTWSQPFYTDTLYPAFHEQPPLGFILQSLFFRIAGDHYLVEKVYSLMAMLGTLLLLRQVWVCLVEGIQESRLKSYSWLPILLWVTIPKWNWAYKNNILENTMGVFCLLSFYFVLIALLTQKRRFIALCSIGAAGALVAAFLTKGLAGLFPLVSPIVMVFTLKDIRMRRGVIVTLICSTTLLLSSACIWASYPLRTNLTLYCNQHLLPALSGQRHTAAGRSKAFWSFAENLSPMLVVLFVRAVITKGKRRSSDGIRHILICGCGCLLVALAGSVPLLVSHKFRSFYLVTSFPFFALGFGLLLCTLIPRVPRKRMHKLEILASSKYSKSVMALILFSLLAWSVSLVGIPRKNRDIYEQLPSLTQKIPPHTIIGGDQTLLEKWSYHALLHRHLLVSLDASQTSKHRDFFLAPPGKSLPSGFVPTALTFEKCLVLERVAVMNNSRETSADQSRAGDVLKAAPEE